MVMIISSNDFLLIRLKEMQILMYSFLLPKLCKFFLTVKVCNQDIFLYYCNRYANGKYRISFIRKSTICTQYIKCCALNACCFFMKQPKLRNSCKTTTLLHYSVYSVTSTYWATTYGETGRGLNWCCKRVFQIMPLCINWSFRSYTETV